MGLFSNPLGYAGYPPGVTADAQVVNSTVRAATAAEAAAGTLDNVYISPLTESSSVALDFASPPVLGFGSTTPRPVHATTLSAVGTTGINTSGSAVTTIGTGGTGATNIGNATGNTAVTGSLTASTGLVATTGGVTATAGNLVTSAAAAGLLVVPTVVSGAASGTVAGNGRVVSITFTGVSIASGATQAFTTSNTSITGSGTVLALSWSGATAGSGLSVVSIANTASQSVITMTNATSATMVTSTANITFTYFVLN